MALDPFDTGIYDAQYLAGLIADDARMTKKDRKNWLARGNCHALCGTIVAWVAAESRFGHELALEWIGSKQENTAQTGWATLGSLIAIRDDESLDLEELRQLLQRVRQTIHQQPNDVRSAMNRFVIAVGTYVAELSTLAEETGQQIGPVSIDIGETACKVPYSPDYIQKARQRGVIGKKRKSAKC